MNTTSGLLGVFLGGALPWLEAVVVIPAGVLAGLPLVPVIAVGALGNLLTVALAAFAGEEIRRRWTAWRSRRGSREPNARSVRNRARIRRLMERGGLPLLALVGPIGIGTQASALMAVAGGSSALRAFIWIAAGTVAWCVVAGIAAARGFALLGIGA